jgi:hypothetical protein
VVVKLWWEGLGFGPRNVDQLIRGYSLESADVDPLWTYVHSSGSAPALNLSTGGHYGRVANMAPGLLTTVHMGHKSFDPNLSFRSRQQCPGHNQEIATAHD